MLTVQPQRTSSLSEKFVRMTAGNEHFKRGEYEKAVAAYAEAIGLRPDDGTSWQNRSIALRQLQRWGEAEQDAARAMELQPSNIKAIFGRAVCLQKLRRFSEALCVADAGIGLQADNKALQQLRREVVVEHSRATRTDVPPASGMATAATSQRRSNSSGSSTGSTSSSGVGLDPFSSCSLAMSSKAAAEQNRELTEEELPCQHLCERAREGNDVECKRLLESGAIKNVNWGRRADGNTALHIAAEEGHEAVIRALIVVRADPETTNNFGLKPVALAPTGGKAYKVLHQLTRLMGDESRRVALKHI